MAAFDCLQEKFSEYPCDIIFGISISLFSSTALFMFWKLQTVLILKLISGISFPCNKKVCAFLVDTDLLFMVMHTPNFVNSSQDFHIRFVKIVIDLKNS